MFSTYMYIYCFGVKSLIFKLEMKNTNKTL